MRGDTIHDQVVHATLPLSTLYALLFPIFEPLATPTLAGFMTGPTYYSADRPLEFLELCRRGRDQYILATSFIGFHPATPSSSLMI